ncbi:hypothetical protein Pcinc_037614 [Petrolisthes cinctipes]|uniref:Uncharacterized protein n=1 Tax=Petrolisthes cinctipes TaxID=88211 RepID=A0AAE1EME6_PETCI|nr:hypothetical protein Pcinc_037614 [Petrolisthes cinctipes]
MSDLERDPIVRFQREALPALSVADLLRAADGDPLVILGGAHCQRPHGGCVLRYTMVLHSTWTVNSLAHWVGTKPYDKHIYPSQNKTVTALTFGEGWHNYHHVFPWDYKTSEFGGFTEFNFTSFVIESCSFFGLAYDLTTVSKKLIALRFREDGEGLDLEEEVWEEGLEMLLPDLYATEVDEDGKVEVVVDDEEEVMDKIRQVLDLEQAARLMEIARKVRHEEMALIHDEDDEYYPREEENNDEGGGGVGGSTR